MPTSAIGAEMRISKSAVIGRAHRLSLPGRPSPIRRDGATPPKPRARRAGAVTLPVVALPTPAEKKLAETIAPRLSSRTCLWPIGHPREKGFRFCGSGAVSGRPYCQAHCAAAYVKTLVAA